MNVRSAFAWKRRYWFGIAAILLVGLALVAEMPALAAPSSAPRHQTVPEPTATPEPAPLPTATPSNGGSDDADTAPGDNDGASGSEAADDFLNDGLLAGAPTGEVVVLRLDVHEGPGADHAIIGTLSSGDRVALVGRSADGAWWAICCVGPEGHAGWANAQSISPDIARADVDATLPVLTNLADLRSGALAQGGVLAVSRTPAASNLTLEIEQPPTSDRRGDQFELIFTVSNVGEYDAEDVALTNQLPRALSYVSAQIEADGTSTQSVGENDAVIISVVWPELAAGESASTVLVVATAPDLPGGSVIDNLAAVEAGNTDGATAGISIGTAPSRLPDF